MNNDKAKKDISLLTNIAKGILEMNSKCYLSGSLALIIQGYKVRRSPKDIDIYCPFGYDFKPTYYMKKYLPDDEMDFYEEGDYERFPFLTNRTSTHIDLFKPISEDIKTLNTIKNENGIKMISWDDIIKMKINHSVTGKSGTSYKHRDDLIYFLIENKSY